MRNPQSHKRATKAKRKMGEDSKEDYPLRNGRWDVMNADKSCHGCCWDRAGVGVAVVFLPLACNKQTPHALLFLLLNNPSLFSFIIFIPRCHRMGALGTQGIGK
jgi:hypothetical protein